MPYLSTAQSFLQNSTLLLSARPTTTRITTKYTILPAKSDSKSATKNPPVAPSSTTHPPMKAVLVLKTYDPVSGTCLKYRTDKAAEVGRLIAALGTCGRVMASLPEKEETKEEDSQRDKEMEDKAVDVKGKSEGPGTQSGRGWDKDGKGKAGAGTGGGAGKKKKGKR